MPLFTPSPLRALKDAGILEGLFPSGKAPQDLPVTLQVSFDSEIVALGNTLTVQATKHFPTKVDFVGDENRLYTLILQDPTAPSAASPTSRSFLHLIKPNLKPLSPDSLIAVASGGADQEHMSLVEIPEEDLMPWMGPSPGKGSGSHKYVFFLVSQPNGKLDLPSDHPLRNPAPEGRRHFNVEKFAQGVLGGGEVVGANFCTVEAEA